MRFQDLATILLEIRNLIRLRRKTNFSDKVTGEFSSLQSNPIIWAKPAVFIRLIHFSNRISRRMRQTYPGFHEGQV